jgi:undecaprenyl-diphosphatase
MKDQPRTVSSQLSAVMPVAAAGPGPEPRPAGPAGLLHEMKRLDLAVYRAVERTHTPALDVPLNAVSRFADHSKLWVAIAAALALFGGRPGRRAAVTGLAAMGLDSALVNLPLKFIGRRLRPDRDTVDGFAARHVRMPTSYSFPSGHSASGFAFANAVGYTMPRLTLPLRVLATIVGYSRVHCGVHYPGDVVVGSLVGMAVGEGTARAAARLRHDGRS